MHDKTGVMKTINKKPSVIIECGCGESKRMADSIAIDIINMDGVDIVADLNKGFPFFDDNSVDGIVSHHFLEHLTSIDLFFKESYRILKKGGKFSGTVPHFSNPYFYSDYTHKTQFGLYSFSYLSKKQFFKRTVPVFYNDLDFEIIKLEIVFYSIFNSRKFPKRIVQKIVNRSKWTQEFYEECFCFMFPAFEIKFELQK